MKYQITRDIQGYPTTGSKTGLKFSLDGQYFDLTASTVLPVTVPSLPYTKAIAVFEYAKTDGAPFVYVQPSASPTLTAPTGTVTATTAELNPSVREVVSGQVLQFLTEQTNVSVTIKYYELS